MSVAYPLIGRRSVQEYMPDEQTHRREMARAVNQLMLGQSNATLTLTLDPGVASTTVIDPRVSLQTAAVLVPMTASAAAELLSIYAVPTKGQVVIHHAVNAATDRTFQMALLG